MTTMTKQFLRKALPLAAGSSSEAFAHQHHELLLALVDLLEVVYELGELDVSVLRQQEGLARLAEELDELAVVARADVREA